MLKPQPNQVLTKSKATPLTAYPSKKGQLAVLSQLPSQKHGHIFCQTYRNEFLTTFCRFENLLALPTSQPGLTLPLVKLFGDMIKDKGNNCFRFHVQGYRKLFV